MKTFYTHQGKIHSDEVMAFVILRKAGYVEDFKRVSRSFDLDSLDDSDYAVDIGRVFDRTNNRIDHHQYKEGETPKLQELIYRRENGTYKASAGMCWHLVGMSICNGDLDVFESVDKALIEGIDTYDADPKYTKTVNSSGGEVYSIDLNGIVNCFNASDVYNHSEQRGAFKKIAQLFEELLACKIEQAEQYLENKARFKLIATVSLEGKVIHLNEGLAWPRIVHESYPEALYIISPCNHSDNPWSMQAVPKTLGKRDLKLPIKRSGTFRGFIHSGEFIAGDTSTSELFDLAEYNINLKKNAFRRLYTKVQEKVTSWFT